MKNIIKAIGLVFCFLCFWYLFFFVLACPYSDDTAGCLNEKMTIYQTQGARAVLGSWKRPLSGQKIFLLGASNTEAVFNPFDLEKLSENFVVFDLTGGSANVTYMQDAFNIAQLMGKSLKGSNVIVGIWYRAFLEDKKLLGEDMTGIRGAALRHGLYKLNGNRLELTIDQKFMPLAVTLLRPFLLCENILLDITRQYDAFCDFVHSGFKGNILTVPNLSNQKYQQAIINKYEQPFGNVDQSSFDEQGQRFKVLCKVIVASGAKLTIVDIPLPKWHRDNSAAYKLYVIKKAEYIREVLKLPGVKYLDFSSQLSDADFQDGVHSNEAGAWKMSRKLLEEINN